MRENWSWKAVGEGVDGEGLCQAGETFEKDVAVAEKTEKKAVHQLMLADEDAGHFLADVGNPAR